MNKNLLIVTALSFSFSTAQAQSLSLDELISLRSKDVDGVNNFLSARGWTFSDAAEETDNQYSRSTWAFGKQYYSGRAKAFVTLMSADGYYNKITYKTSVKSHFDLLKSRILAYKMLKTSSSVNDGSISTTYVGKSYIVESWVSTDSESSIPVYGIKISKRPVVPVAVDQPVASDTYSDNEGIGLSPESTSLTEVLQPSQVASYKARIGSESNNRPPDSDYIFTDFTREDCLLFSTPSAASSNWKSLSKYEKVYVISRLLDEDHQYYLVWAAGYFGYLKNSETAGYSDRE